MEAYEIDQCIDQFGTDIYRFCMKLCMDKEDAEDLYQQTFLKALESDYTLHWEQNPKALFFSFAHNIWKSTVRKYKRRSSIAPCSSIDKENADLIASKENVEEDYLKKELYEKVNVIIEELPDKIRIPLTLYYLFDFPVEQISKMVQTPPGTIKSCLYKGRSIIKKRLEETGYGRK